MAQSDTERAVLFVLLHEPDARDQIFGKLTAKHFSGGTDRDNGQLFVACRELWEAKKPIEPVTIINELQNNNWPSSIVGDILEKGMGTLPSLDHYITELQNCWNRYSLAEMCSSMAHAVMDNPSTDISDPVDKLKVWLTEYEESKSRKDTVTMAQAVSEFLDMKDQSYENTTITTGMPDLDRWVKIARGDMVIVAGRPSIGKSTWIYNMIRTAAKPDQPVLLVSLEVRPAFVAMPMLAAQSSVPMARVEKPTDQLSDTELQKIVVHSSAISDLPIKITRDETIEGICSKVRREARLNPNLIVVIDYIQLVVSSSKHGSREQEVAHISRTIKNLAHECNVPVFALAQLNRLAAGQRPKIEHLRESGSIEQDADTVLLLHSEDYQQSELDSTNPTVTEMVIGKQRRGKTGAFKMVFRKDIARFDGYSREDV